MYINFENINNLEDINKLLIDNIDNSLIISVTERISIIHILRAGRHPFLLPYTEIYYFK